METLDIINIVGNTFDFLGKVLVAYAAIAVHHRFRHEHQVDDAVFMAMRREQILAYLGIIMLTVGFVLHLISDLSY